ncbi:MAG: hypothetical protein L0Z07_09070 [Planctomycetes bacterium]|nr:hypothetical protein [Planctomycetota bacterium]
MRRINNDTVEMPGQDSFLDVVTNIVGILILLVMVMGVRASRSMDQVALVSPAFNSPAEPVDENQRSELIRSATSAQRDVAGLIQRAVSMNQEAQLRQQERLMLTTLVAEAEQDIKNRRAKLSAEEQRDFDLRQNLTEAQGELEQLTREQVAIVSQSPEVEQIDCLPTPLGKIVTGKEVHLRIDQGHVVFVPLDELAAEMNADAKRNVWRLRNQSRFTSRIGPIEGFRAEYIVGRVAFRANSSAGVESSGYMAQLIKMELIPESSLMGEPVAQAILPDSDLMRRLRTLPPDTTTVTMWTYTNSFADYNTLRRALFELGYTTAANPLPDGVPITGSPYGSKSVTD